MRQRVEATAIIRKPRGRSRYASRAWPRLALTIAIGSVASAGPRDLVYKSCSLSARVRSKRWMRLIKILKNQAARTCLTALRPRSGGTEWMGCGSAHARGLQRTRSKCERMRSARRFLREKLSARKLSTRPKPPVVTPTVGTGTRSRHDSAHKRARYENGSQNQKRA